MYRSSSKEELLFFKKKLTMNASFSFNLSRDQFYPHMVKYFYDYY